MIDDDGWFHQDFDPTDFRRAATRYVKFLILARWMVNPGFLTPADLRSWGLADIDQEPREPWKLMRHAADALAILNPGYLSRGDSGGVRPIRPVTPVARLIDALAFLAQVEGGAPEFNQKLLDATATLQRGGTVDWDQLVDWSKLPAIRRDLDLLPEPRGSETTDSGPAQYVFKYKADSCQICYGASGVQAIVGPQLGLYYIWYLIRHAPGQLSAADLLQAHFRYCRPKDFSSYGDEYDEPAEADHGRRQDTYDTTRFEDDMRNTIANRTADLETARAAGKAAEAKKLVEEIAKIEQVLKNQRFQGKTTTEVENLAKNQRDKVLNAINRARCQISSISPSLALHLVAAIKTKGGFRYAPEADLHWDT